MQVNTHNTNSLSDRIVLSHVQTLTAYTQTLREASKDVSYSLPEASLRTPFDVDVLENVIKKTERFSGKTKLVLIIGIGGSDMGTRAVYDALRGHFADFQIEGNSPKLISFSTVEPQVLSNIKDSLKLYSNPEDVVLVVISKSGTTTETIANANILFSLFSEQFGKEQAEKQTIIISGENSTLTKQSVEKGILTFSLPQNVGGRFSVFTTVGLVPLQLLGFNVHSFFEGAQRGIQASTTEERPSSGAVLASYLFEAYLKGSRIHELFLWNPELEMLGKWYRQLLAESIGKVRDDGTAVGFSPTIAIGSTDLHSVGQLIFGGRNDRYTTFVSAPNEWQTSKQFQNDSLFMLPVLKDKQSGQVIKAIYEGVQATYNTSDLPYVSIELEEINEREIGAFMALQMTTILYLAQLFDVNAFDQPAVETYKSKVRHLLTR